MGARALGALPLRRSLGPEPGRSAAGITTIEILVATTIFLIVLVAVEGSFTRFVAQNRLRLSQNFVLRDLHSFVETLEREIRTGFGSSFAASADGTALSFTNQNGVAVTYARSGNRITRNGQPVTSAATETRELLFGPVAAPTIDPGVPPLPPLLTGRQGLVTVRIKACPAGQAEERCISIQTTLASRQMRAAP